MFFAIFTFRDRIRFSDGWKRKVLCVNRLTTQRFGVYVRLKCFYKSAISV